MLILVTYQGFKVVGHRRDGRQLEVLGLISSKVREEVCQGRRILDVISCSGDAIVRRLEIPDAAS